MECRWMISHQHEQNTSFIFSRQIPNVTFSPCTSGNANSQGTVTAESDGTVVSMIEKKKKILRVEHKH